MGGSITPDELAALQRDPQRLMAEIARYTQIRDDAESKLRAVVDETTALELRQLAEDELRKANIALTDADAQAKHILELARSEAAGIQLTAETEANALLTSARDRTKLMDADAAEAERRAQVLQSSLEERASNANRAKAEAERAVADNGAAAAEYRAATADIESTRQRLSALVKEMAEIVGV